VSGSLFQAILSFVCISSKAPITDEENSDDILDIGHGILFGKVA